MDTVSSTPLSRLMPHMTNLLRDLHKEWMSPDITPRACDPGLAGVAISAFEPVVFLHIKQQYRLHFAPHCLPERSFFCTPHAQRPTHTRGEDGSQLFLISGLARASGRDDEQRAATAMTRGSTHERANQVPYGTIPQSMPASSKDVGKSHTPVPHAQGAAGTFVVRPSAGTTYGLSKPLAARQSCRILDGRVDGSAAALISTSPLAQETASRVDS